MSGLHDLIIGGLILAGSLLFGGGSDSGGRSNRRRRESEITEIDIDAALERQRRDIERRGEENHIRITKDFERKLKNARDEHRKNLKDMSSDFESKIRAQAGEFKNLMQSQRDELVDAIQKEKDIIQSRIDDINDKLNARNLIEREKSSQWLENYRAAIENIKNFDYKKFVPDDVVKLESRFIMVEGNHADGLYEASIPGSQEGYLEADEVLRKVMILTSEWDIAANVAKSEIEKLTAFFNENQKFPLEIDLKAGGKCVENVDICHWSLGKFDESKKELDGLNYKMKELNSFSVEEIYELIKRMGEVKAKMLLTIDRSLKNFSAHILRQEIQEVIAEKLSKSGYMVMDNFWEKDDSREKNILILQNSEDEKILITLGYNFEKEKIGFHWETNMKNKHDREERANSILASINSELGMNVEEGTTVAGPRDEAAPEENFDVEKLKKRQQR